MIFNLFKSGSKLGIDVGTASIKAIELEKRGGRFALTNYGLFELTSTSTNAEGSILKLPDQEITWGISELLKKSKIKSRAAVASIGSFSTFATVIEMPYLSEQDLAKAVPFEAKKYIPLPLDEVNLDWAIIGVSGDGGLKAPTGSKPTIVEVFLAAVPKDEVSRYQKIMKGAGLDLKALELENSALARALIGNDLSPIAIVNIGGRSTSIIIVDKGYERVAHNYEIGGFEITKSISRSLNVSLDKAEELKRKFGLKPIDENIVNDSMVSLIDLMVFETKKTITNFEETKTTKINKIILAGGLTNMPNFAEYFSQKLGRQVSLGNAFARIIYPDALKSHAVGLSNTFAVATGLAMRDL